MKSVIRNVYIPGVSSRKETRRRVRAKAVAAQVRRRKHSTEEFKDTWNRDWIVIGVRYDVLVESVRITSGGRRDDALWGMSWSAILSDFQGEPFPKFLLWNSRERYAVRLMSKSGLLEFVQRRRGKQWAVYGFHLLVKRALKMTLQDIEELLAINCAGPDATHMSFPSIVHGLLRNLGSMNNSSDVIEAAELLTQRHFAGLCPAQG